jgi:hypothetical protein
MSIMQNTSAVSPRTDTLLRYTLRGNSIFSAVSGLVCIVNAEWLAAQFGNLPPLFIVMIGVGLLGYATALFYVTQQARITRAQALTFVLADAAWVVGSIVLLVTNWLPLTTVGWWLEAVTAVSVASFAELQFVGMQRLPRD